MPCVARRRGLSICEAPFVRSADTSPTVYVPMIRVLRPWGQKTWGQTTRCALYFAVKILFDSQMSPANTASAAPAASAFNSIDQPLWAIAPIR